MGNYDDIINLPHHVSTKHPRMSDLDRAAQFSPFAALTGHRDAVIETARLTDARPQLDENRKEELDESLQIILAHLSLEPEVCITYFVPDQKKAGGSFLQVRGVIKKIDETGHKVVLNNGTSISIDDIYEMDSSCIPDKASGNVFSY